MKPQRVRSLASAVSVVVGFVLIVSLVGRANAFSSLPDRASTPGDVVQRVLPTAKVLTVMGLTPREHSFTDVERVFGMARRFPSPFAAGDHHRKDSEWMCYVSSRPGDRTALIFEQGSFLSFAGRLDQIVLVAAEVQFNGRGNCAASSLVSTTLTTASGLGLGMGRQTFLRQLGNPDLRTLDQLIFLYNQQLAPSEPTTIVWIDVGFNGGKSVYLRLIVEGER